MPDPIADLGPLAPLAGVWEGDGGEDSAPDAARAIGQTPYRERLVLEPIGRIDNHEQVLQALRYATTAWRPGEEAAFHEEVGYWLWDAENQQVMRTFLVPRGISILAGGTVAPDAREFSLAADLGSPTYGICSNPFLDAEFKTVRYELTVRLTGPDRFEYEEDTQMMLRGREEIFHHTDRNALSRVG